MPEVTVEQQAVTSTVVETPSTTAEPEPVEDNEEVTPEPGEAAEEAIEPVAEDVAAVEESLESVTEGPVESETVEDSEIAVPEGGDVGQAEGPVGVVAEHWRHGLDEEALALIDPESVGADRWGQRGEGSGYREKVFYMFLWFHDPEGDTDGETEMLGGALNIVRSKLEPPNTVYHPVRYDLRWAEYPVEASITGYYPVGEIRILNAFFDGSFWRADTIVYTPGDSSDAGAGVAIPAGPPIKSTTPFAEPRWPDTAEALGRDCLPVEDLWTTKDAPVKDQCTLDAIDTALRYVWASPSELRQRAIRDGHVLTDLLARFDNQHEINSFLGARMGEDGRSRVTVNVQDVRWAGYWPGASMIYLEYQLVWADREITEEERQGGIRYFTLLAEQGYSVGTELLRGEIDFGRTRFWDAALMVRTADGTWRACQIVCVRGWVHGFLSG